LVSRRRLDRYRIAGDDRRRRSQRPLGRAGGPIDWCGAGDAPRTTYQARSTLMNSVVVHYKELALKGRNRPWFIQLLVRNLRWALADFDIASVRSVMGRIEIELGRDVPWSDISDRVRCVFGIANFSHAGRAPLDFQEMANIILTDLGERSP